MDKRPVIVRIETESGACLRRIPVVAGSFVDVRDIARAIREELERVQRLDVDEEKQARVN